MTSGVLMRRHSITVAGIAILYSTMLCSSIANAESTTLFSSIFQDHAVLQRDKPIALWGDAKSADGITVSLGESSVHTNADATGHWSATLPALAGGGPYSLSAQSSSG